MRIIEHELTLLYLYSSAAYLEELRDVWQSLISHVEYCICRVERNCRADHSSRHGRNQSPIIWHDRIVPNFRATLSALCEGYIELSNGDIAGLTACYGVLSDFKGQLDFDASWMEHADLDTYASLLNKCVRIARNIRVTESALWQPSDLSSEHDPTPRAGLSLPAQSADYRLNPSVTVSSQGKLSFPGIYVPDVEHSCAQFLVPYRAAPKAFVLKGRQPSYHPVTGEVYGETKVVEKVDCNWILVEAVNPAETGTMPPIEGGI